MAIHPAETQAARPPTQDDIGVDGFEPGLLPPSTRLLRSFATARFRKPYIAFLEDRVRRDPRDLRAHVERVLQCASDDDADALRAALVDLNVVLGDRGRALRAHLFRRFAQDLSRPHREFLSARLDSGVDAVDPDAATAGACLVRPVEGTMQIVTRNGAVASVTDLAGRVSTAGDDMAACQLLEEALEVDPGRADVSAVLLALYRRTRRRVDFERARTRLLGRRLALAAQWDQTADWFTSLAEDPAA